MELHLFEFLQPEIDTFFQQKFSTAERVVRMRKQGVNVVNLQWLLDCKVSILLHYIYSTGTIETTGTNKGSGRCIIQRGVQVTIIEVFPILFLTQ